MSVAGLAYIKGARGSYVRAGSSRCEMCCSHRRQSFEDATTLAGIALAYGPVLVGQEGRRGLMNSQHSCKQGKALG